MPLAMEVDLGPGHIVLDGTQLPPTERGTAALSFQPMSVVAARSPISAVAELLFLSDLILDIFSPSLLQECSVDN